MLAVCSALSVKPGVVTHTLAPVEFTLPFRISDSAAGSCGLRGYPRVRPQMATNGKLVGELIPRATRIPAGHPVTPPVVLLDPSWPATTSISWPEFTCKAVPFNRVRVWLPDVRTPFTMRLRRPIGPCGERITVAPIG